MLDPMIRVPWTMLLMARMLWTMDFDDFDEPDDGTGS